MSTQEEAIRRVGEAFGAGSTDGMTEEQRRAFERVQREFAPRPAEDIITSPRNELRLGMVDPDSTDAMRASQRIADTNTESALAGFEAQRQQFLQTQQRERDTLRDERRDLAQQQADAMEGFSQEEIVRREREELGVPAMLDEQQIAIQEIRGLREQYTNLEQQKGEALALSDGRQAPIGFIRGEKARIAEQFDRRQATVAARMQSETAHMQAMQGMVSQARSLIGDIVNAATFDTELEMKRIQTFREVNAQEIAELDRDFQNQLQESQRYWENRLQTERQEKSQIVDWMIQVPRSGITINDTLEEAAEKASIQMGVREVEQVAQAALKAGASKDLVDTIRSADSPGEAMSIIAGSGIAMEKEDLSSASDDFAIQLTPNNRRNLAGIGFSTDEIQDIEFVVNSSGIRPLLETLVSDDSYTIEQATRVAQVFDAMQVLDQVEQELSPVEEKSKSWWQFWK